MPQKRHHYCNLHVDSFSVMFKNCNKIKILLKVRQASAYALHIPRLSSRDEVSVSSTARVQSPSNDGEALQAEGKWA
jgi:hypothetical protein